MNALTTRLHQQLQTNGPITFCEFMQQALYDPQDGYYQNTTEKIGRQGDYYTAANIDAIFGELLARHCYQLYQELSRQRVMAGEAPLTTPLTVLEVGAGTGQLAADILAAWPTIAPANCRLHYRIWEPSPSLRVAQQAKLTAYLPGAAALFAPFATANLPSSELLPGADTSPSEHLNLSQKKKSAARTSHKRALPRKQSKAQAEERYLADNVNALPNVSALPQITVEWIEDLAHLKANPFTGIILANEVADALPVHCLRWQQDKLWEMYVASEQGKLVTTWYPNTNARIVDYLTTLEAQLLAGQTIEVGLAMVDWQRQLAEVLHRGFLITIDYGDLVDHLYSPEHFNGTLRGFSRHRLITAVTDLLTNVGEQDITADVNFSALITYGQKCGLQTRFLLRQTEYLIKGGLLDRLAQLIAQENNVANLRRQLAWRNFFIPGGISDHFKVLVQEKVHSLIS